MSEHNTDNRSDGSVVVRRGGVAQMNRRLFAQHMAGAMLGSALVSPTSRAGRSRGRTNARGDDTIGVLFDALALFDARPVTFVAEEVFPGRGAELMTVWRTRQFEYAWLRVVMGQYEDFWRCTDDALTYSVASLGFSLTVAQRRRLMHAYLELRPWPDVLPLLKTLRSTGTRVGVLSNFSPSMLNTLITGARLADQFEHLISTDQARTYKPDPRAYQLGIETLRLPRERIVFVAFAGWDAAGAKQFGYPTFWVNRLQAPPEEIGAPAPDGSGRSLNDLATLLSAIRAR